MSKLTFERGKLDDGMGYSFFGEIENNERNGLGVLHWDLDESHKTYYSYAFGFFKDDYRSGFGVATSNTGLLLNSFTQHWDADGCSVHVSENEMDFFYEHGKNRINRSFLFTKDSNILKVSFYNEKGED